MGVGMTAEGSRVTPERFTGSSPHRPSQATLDARMMRAKIVILLVTLAVFALVACGTTAGTGSVPAAPSAATESSAAAAHRPRPNPPRSRPGAAANAKIDANALR